MEPIAIVGMACRFPGANNPQELWELLLDGRDAITQIPADRWNAAEYHSSKPQAPGKMNTQCGGFIDGFDQFDAEFFGIRTREACYMDPQQRIVLEVAWESLESAGLAPEKLAGTQTSVFAGISNFDYNRLLCRDVSTLDAYSSTGTIQAIAANRLSYLLNLHGPSMAIDTACSSSLVAVHLACQSLRNGESDLAIAGGVNLILTPEVSIILSQSGLISPTGRCRTFDAQADGYVRSEGCGFVVLERLSDSLKERRNIVALVRGSAVNQDGRTNGLTAPSGASQQAVLRRAMANAQIEAGMLGYIEAHGTGTQLGDIIEVRSLRAALAPGRSCSNRCAISSIKTNIGHAESAAGIAGLIKAALILQHECIPAHRNLSKLNKHIKIDGHPLFIPERAVPWPRGDQARLAGINSFGIGGTNAHVIVEEAPLVEQPPARAEQNAGLLVLSAKSAEGLRALGSRYVDFLSGEHPLSLSDICFTARNGRSHFEYRLGVVADSVAQVRARLSGFLDGVPTDGLTHGKAHKGSRPQVTFSPAGESLDTIAGAEALCKIQPVFRDVFLDLLNVAPSDPASAVQRATIEMWRSWGIEGGLANASPPLSAGHNEVQIDSYSTGWREILFKTAELFVRGVTVNWLEFDRGNPARFVQLPFYPFQRKRFWYTDMLPR